MDISVIDVFPGSAKCKENSLIVELKIKILKTRSFYATIYGSLSFNNKSFNFRG